MSSPSYLNYGDSSYKQGCVVIGTSTSNGNGNALKDKSITIIQIPSYHNGKEVVEIGYGGFSDTNIEKVFIPKTVLFLNDFCFLGCSSLTEIRFEEGSLLERIGLYSIYNIKKLEKLDVPKSLSQYDTIESSALYPGFSELYSLTCISYLGATDFSSYDFFRNNVPANIYVSSSHPDKFGGKSVTGRDKTCGVSKLPLNYAEYNADKGKTRIIRRRLSCYVYCMILLVSS